MSKRKGLSAEDKRRVILSVYHDRKEPFNLKEIETIGSKLGVVQQTIKDVNQSLIDDFLVLSDKIGSANFFWSFPSKAYQDQIVQKDQLESSLNHSNAKIVELNAAIQTARQSRNAPNREANMKKLEALKAQEASLDGNLESLKFNDPEEIQKVKNQLDANVQAVNRWTDNIWTIKAYLVKKKGMAGKEADKVLGIDSSFDYANENDESAYLGSNKKARK